MAKADILNILYSRGKRSDEFDFESIWIPTMLNYITIQDIQALNKIATSLKYSSKIDLKYKAIDDILRPRGFKKLASGTNRIVYSYLEDQRFVLKVALDKVGLKDSPDEYMNQFKLKPFVTKVFEVSPCGTVATVERVQPITSQAEFISIADDIFHLITHKLIGKYVLEDIGTKYFMNWGVRNGFGPVLLDYPYLFELDDGKLRCNRILPTGNPCIGIIDYDEGFNKLLCPHCGKVFLATELKKAIEDNLVICTDSDIERLKIQVKRGNVIEKDFSEISESDIIIRK